MEDTTLIKKNYGLIYCILFFVSIFILSLYLFHLEATKQIASDVTLHLDFIDPIISGKLSIPHEGFEYSVYILSKLFRSTYITTSTFFLSLVLLVIAGIKFFLLKRLANIPTNLALIFSVALMLVSAICFPMFNANLYIGQGSPTVWHNPTLLCVKPFAFIGVYLAIRTIDTSNKQNWLILSVLLLISFFYKPSFGIVFVPAICIYILCKNARNYSAYLYYFLMILPSLLFACVIQLHSWLFLPKTTNSIILSPFGVLHLYTPNAFVSFILATAFPLFFLVFNPKRVLTNQYLFLSWIMLGIGYLQFAFLAETQYFKYANFAWGFLIALDLVFVFSFIELINWSKESKMTLISMPSVLILLFLAHLISGIGYLGRYIVTGNFM